MHRVPAASLNQDQDNVALARQALERKSRGVHKPRVEINVEGSQLVFRDEAATDVVRAS